MCVIAAVPVPGVGTGSLGSWGPVCEGVALAILRQNLLGTPPFLPTVCFLLSLPAYFPCLLP